MELLKIKALSWVETPEASGVCATNGAMIPVADEELAFIVKAIVKIQDESGTDFTLQSLVLQLRAEGKLVRLERLRQAIEFLHLHGLIENPSARGWVELLQRQGLPSRLPLWRRLRGIIGQQAGVTYDPYEWEKLPVVRQLDPSVRKEFLQGARVRRFPKGFRLCRQGSRDRTLMILLSGQAGVIRKIPGEKPHLVAVLEKQAMFGETSHFLDEPRTADVLALEDCMVLCIPPKSGEPELHRQQFQKLQTRVWFLQALQRNPIFQDIPGEAFDALLLNGQVRNFTAGEALVREGEAAESCYFLIQGTARIEKGGKEINRLTSGSVIGEVALMLGRGGRTATAIANTDVIAIVYESDEFWTVLSQHFVLGLALERLADKRLARDEARAG